MYVCMYVCCMYVCTYVCMYVCMYVCITGSERSVVECVRSIRVVNNRGHEIECSVGCMD